VDINHQHTVTPPVTPPQRNPLIGFRIHGIVYFATLFMLLLFDAGFEGPKWVHYVFFGWGIGLVAHGLAAALKRKAQQDGKFE
jgi:hypothetical protein